MTEARPFTADEKLQCAKREVSMRQRVYAFRVTQGKMQQSAADREIALMAAIVDLEKLAQGERLL
jgi:hypothetical protein